MDRKLSENILSFSEKLKPNAPTAAKVKILLDCIVNTLFPIRDSEKPVNEELINKRIAFIRSELTRYFKGLDCSENPEKQVEFFFEKLNEIYSDLTEDACNFCHNDPASCGIEEVILAYPGFYAITVYRISNLLHKMGVPFLPRIISELAHGRTGIDIHPGATIGKQFYIDHGTGIVIGETTVIGNNVKIYQGVTLGALYVDKELKGKRRHPSIEDNVIIYSGSTILGGETVIGRDTVIGGNVWLTHSVPAYSTVYREAKIRIREQKCK